MPVGPHYAYSPETSSQHHVDKFGAEDLNHNVSNGGDQANNTGNSILESVREQVGMQQ